MSKQQAVASASLMLERIEVNTRRTMWASVAVAVLTGLVALCAVSAYLDVLRAKAAMSAAVEHGRPFRAEGP